jgi:alpha-beta hydrolase superfamily lysophospholipase
VRIIAFIFALTLIQACGPSREIWHSVKLTEEFTASKSSEINDFSDYQAMEERLFAELDEKIYAHVDTGADYQLVRYSRGSMSDPRDENPDWNRSFELPRTQASGAVLLLHGMSDSPYSLRALALSLHERGYSVLGMRLPGHGTAPSGMVHVKPADMIAATRLAMTHLRNRVGDKPIHIIGYSTGAALAINFALEAMNGNAAPTPASLILISPAIRIHGAAGLAGFKNSLSYVPGLGNLAWLNVMPEFDPYRYNSFATNAASVVHRLTTSVDERITRRIRSAPEYVLPPILVFKSTVDYTVTTEAVVDNLLMRLRPDRNHLVLYDINRSVASTALLNDNSGSFTTRLMKDDSLPFAVTFIGNEQPESSVVVKRHKKPYSKEAEITQVLEATWPAGVLSLSHIALPFSPDDPIHGRVRPEEPSTIYLGSTALRGETGLHRIPANWLLRMRYNPFYDSMESMLFDWLDKSSAAASRP